MSQLLIHFDELAHGHWLETDKGDRACVKLADRHYSRQKVGSSQFTRPGFNFVLRNAEATSVWVSYLSRYRKDNLDAIECCIFRNESKIQSSLLIFQATWASFKRYGIHFKDGLITYVASDKVKSTNPGYCYLKAGYRKMNIRSKSKNLLAFQCTFQDLLASEKITPDFLVNEYEEVYEKFKSAVRKQSLVKMEKYRDMMKNIREVMDYYSLFYPEIDECEVFSRFSEYPDVDEWGEGMSEFLGEYLMEEEFSQECW